MSEPTAEPTLREIVLRLICSETPRLSATSSLDLREQQATAFLKSAEAKKLHQSRDALDFLNRFNAQTPLLDELADMFLLVAESPLNPTGLLNPYVVQMFVCDEILYAFRIVMLGASAPIMERMMVQIVRCGWWRDAEALAKRLNRPLTRDEILRMVQSYTRGATYSLHDDEEWITYVLKHLGSEDVALVQSWINKRNENYHNRLD